MAVQAIIPTILGVDTPGMALNEANAMNIMIE